MTETENKHSTSRIRDIAMGNTILLSQVGSQLYGVTTGSQDRDEMGICIEPPSCVIGLESFEQYQTPPKPQGVRSGPGDLDLTIYSLRKWARLAAQGNPSVLLLIYVPDSAVISIEEPGTMIRQWPELFISRQAGYRFRGYLDAQKEQMLGLRSKHTNRPELIDVYGFDTKFAYHAVRLGIQGVELLSTGRITLPIPEPDRSWLIDLRLGKHSKEEALERISDLRFELDRLTATANLPDKPNYSLLNGWLTDTYQDWWDKSGVLDMPISGHLTSV